MIIYASFVSPLTTNCIFFENSHQYLNFIIILRQLRTQIIFVIFLEKIMDPPRIFVSSQNELSSVVIGTQPTRDLPDQGVPTASQNTIGGNFKKGDLPFGLSLQQIPSAAAILSKKPEMYQALLDMNRGKLEHSSFKTYNNNIRHFSDFCKNENINIMQFTEQDVVLYLAQCSMEGKKYSFYKTLKPALVSFEGFLERKPCCIAITDNVIGNIESLKRIAAAKKPPVKKAVPFKKPELSKMFDHVLGPNFETIQHFNLIDIRSLLRAVIIYWTWIRFDDYKAITDQFVFDCDTYIKITFPRSKNDPFYFGTFSYIPETGEIDCPVRIIRFIFRKLGLVFAYGGQKTRFLNCMVQKKGNIHKPILSRSLSCTTATQHMRNLVNKCGIIGKHYTEKSYKVGGVTEFLHDGNTLEMAMVRGRWKAVNTPMYYRNDDEDFRLFLAKLSILPRPPAPNPGQ